MKHLPDSYTRLEFNALIERLIMSSGSDAEAREAVASLGSSLDPRKGISVEGSISFPSGGMSGATQDHGEVQIDADQEEKRTIQLGVGTAERIGLYKISRARQRRLFVTRGHIVVIRSFWKSDLSTASEIELPEAWGLSCDLQMRPCWFGRFVYQTFGWAGLSFTIELIEELWGTNPGKLHYYDFQISVTNA